ncbi:hypothetical protein A3D84_04920 [Candidatus Woesebacteria bacterium RIFCSPHIGHO2_02_FULL_42_20]|uniref:Urease accessory protein UreH-like transmembrane domain-containing protein n=1 Tax=Candidatus Woesebacteria bacterium RIFCSPHIGHO2_12_FULL_41_24 TaxID=1802510 RepID=A0A1F8AUT8_9BACT|nr:MAG: hypothetical protein A2W15_00635 [Candidatus Woesebacteria bacterium RBG_16_41_13]OGM30323.1 MAG: hypothetical protein A2873_05340 [Candidatus Woesebacteria bacterium RIFCSPHIGHO2_01_FULL_42_80]OGM34362.1 MAG: hypothetical protein A3D84_04920 [Candidatus Woesebacteria bacterium RIFCSPHIGHO2_02_FULL_42_20]OGM55496.1 MAG: hypothetical protein A3E44_01075 [Candidatus Woesebacteria bacterium RIFCSPHIGHO2_12_FULL_41_24]OGM68219.1 MAG: hypothetical protein A2969_00975 [Candidatus Woesebacteri
MNTFWLAFVTGLTTGGVSCLAVQGGLLSSTIANQQSTGSKQTVAAFLASKLLAYTILGGLLGLIGSAVTFSLTLQGLMQIAAGLFMLATAGRLLNLHPVFRYTVFTPPKFILRKLRNRSHNASTFAPAFLGGLTVFIPCGVTQAMMVLAVASGSVFSGAAIMFFFTLGTTPVFGIIGAAALELLSKKPFAYLAASVVTILGILAINTGQVLRGSPHTIQNYIKVAAKGQDAYTLQGKTAGLDNAGMQVVSIDVSNYGYSASASVLKVGVPVKLKLKTQNVTSCSRAFTIPVLNLTKILPESGEEILEFTPAKPGRLAYNCSMGMYTGSFTVVE